MTNRNAVVVVCVVLAVLVSPTILAQESPTPTQDATNESDAAGMGTQLTAFLQSSSAAANDSVEDGMWAARFEGANASQQARLVTNRTDALGERLDRLRERNATIQARYENGSLPEPAYVAQQSRLSARIDALQAAINDTDAAAAEAGVNDSRLKTLRRNASNLTGPQVATIARGLGGGPPAAVPGQGPPANQSVGPPTNQTAGPPGNQSAGPPTNQTGPGDQSNQTDTRGDGTRGGPPSDETTDSGSDGDTGADTSGDAGADAGSDAGDGAGGGGSGGGGGGPSGPP